MRERLLSEADYLPLIQVMDDWWGGRPMRALLPRLFFQHFQDTSWVIEHQNTVVAFLVGFYSQTDADLGYIHFVGVHPAYRTQGLGTRLYRTFFDAMGASGRHRVETITSPVNRGSIAFHQRMGFDFVPGDAIQDGIPVHQNYDGRGGDRVLFRKTLP
ncbi:MAG: GNAT family N-acetyltransferase [Firmicutes bacterium]|nr:GNAT family N-acetyltransferase [Bacillota bacterium]